MRFFYNLGLYLILLASFLRKKSRKTFKKRLGRGFPKIDKKDRQLIWIHAVSMGETKAVAPLVRQLKDHPSNPIILLTTVTTTGHQEGQRNIPEADYHLFLPFDLPNIIRPIVKQINPDLVVLVETDFWLHFQTAANEIGAKVVLVNGKLSSRSFRRFSFFRKFAHHLFSSIDHFCVQGDLYAERFAQIGVPKEKISVTGNIKLDGLQESKSLELGIKSDDLVVTLGSTHDPEERILLQALEPLFSQFPKLKILLVPRHPERFEEVRKMLDTYIHREKVILVDKMGVLRSCYKQSTLAFVGGTFAPKVGGHNILEPAYFGVPVIYGPHIQSQPDFHDLVQNYQAGVQISEKDLTQIFSILLQSAEQRQKLGDNGLRLIQESSGAVEATSKILHQIFPPDTLSHISRDGAVVSSLGS